MTTYLRSINHLWHFLFFESADIRSRGWFLVDSPIPPILLMIGYYYTVRKIGPAFMENRKPFNVDKIIQIYNILQILICGWLSYQTFMYSWGPYGNYALFCQPLNRTLTPHAIRLARYSWYYYMIKIVDLLDTMFFILRKKFSQATFLHVYHHMGTIVLGYIGSKYYPDGHGYLVIPLNSLVHCFMYFYYFLTNYNPEYKKNIWWKKYITQMQIIQFLILVLHLGVVFFKSSCAYPLLPVLLFYPQLVLMLVLFSNFYKKAYLTPKQLLESKKVL